MQGFVNLAVGEPYQMPYRLEDGMTPVLYGASLTFVVTLRDVNDQEAKAFCAGNLEYGLFVDADIPIMLCNFRGCAEFDAYINTHLEPKESQNAFLRGDPESNLLQFYLVDTKSGLLRGIRGIGAPKTMIPDLKEACIRRLSSYPSASAVKAAADSITAKYSIKQLMARTSIFKVVGKL